MTRYLNVTSQGFRAGVRPTKRTLGKVENVPNYSLAENVTMFVFKHFEKQGLIRFGQTHLFGHKGWILTDKGFSRLL